MADEVIETTATPVEEPADKAVKEAPEETLEQRVARITQEVNEYLVKNGLQLQVEHRCVIVPMKNVQTEVRS